MRTARRWRGARVSSTPPDEQHAPQRTSAIAALTGPPAVRWGGAGIVLAALLVLAGLQRWPGVDPASLWLDDLWVGLTVREMGLADLFHYRPPIPIGFVYVLKAVTGVLGIGEWQLQMFPLLCGLLAIPSVALLAFQLSRSLPLALLAGAATAFDPLLAAMSLRVKQYSSDAFVVSLVLNVAVLAANRRTLRSYRAFVAVCVVVTWISASSLFVTALSFAWVTLVVWRSRRGAPAPDRPFWTSAAIFPALSSVFLALVAVQQRNVGMLRYWRSSFLPLDDLNAAVSFLKSKEMVFLGGAFVPELSWLCWLVPIGIIGLLVRPRTRGFGAFAGLFYLQALALSALKLYPLGGGRVDAYSHAVTIVVATMGLRTLAPRQALPWLASVALAGVVWFSSGEHYDYGIFSDKQATQRLNDAARPGDAIVVYPHASYAIGFYGRWPTKLIRAPASSNGFYATADRPDVALLPEFEDGVFFRKDLTIMEPKLNALLAKHPPRVHYLAAHLRGRSHRWILDTIRSHGYADVTQYDDGKAAHYLFERIPELAPPAPGP